MAAQMEKLGYDNVFIGTVEGEPEETACENVIAAVKEAGYTKVILRPLMVVAGDHANNDMAGDDDDSWKSQFVASGNFESVDCLVRSMRFSRFMQHIPKQPSILLGISQQQHLQTVMSLQMEPTLQNSIPTAACFM